MFPRNVGSHMVYTVLCATRWQHSERAVLFVSTVVITSNAAQDKPVIWHERQTQSPCSALSISSTLQMAAGVSYETLVRIYQPTSPHILPFSSPVPQQTTSPDEVTGFFNLPNPSSRTVALRSTQPLTGMSTRNIPEGERTAGA
jgi:hypothetical protein